MEVPRDWTLYQLVIVLDLLDRPLLFPLLQHQHSDHPGEHHPITNRGASSSDPRPSLVAAAVGPTEEARGYTPAEPGELRETGFLRLESASESGVQPGERSLGSRGFERLAEVMEMSFH